MQGPYGQKLPSLKALRAFEASARHGSFTRAATELGVTQGAISKQVGLLEDYLCLRLFMRKGREIVLSPEGERYLPHITSAFDAIALATDELMGTHGRREHLTVDILPSLSSRWFIPLLEDFRNRQPSIAVRVIIGDGPVDFNQRRRGYRHTRSKGESMKHLHAEPLMGEELLPVASPALLKKQAVKKPADFLHFTLLQHTSRPDMWRDYLQAAGIKDPKIKHDLGFEHFFMLAQAAMDGLGIALIPRFLIARELKEKSLAVVRGKPYQSPYRYYFICPKSSGKCRKTRPFRDWLITSIALNPLSA